jgi:hypothetical protein
VYEVEDDHQSVAVYIGSRSKLSTSICIGWSGEFGLTG